MRSHSAWNKHVIKIRKPIEVYCHQQQLNFILHSQHFFSTYANVSNYHTWLCTHLLSFLLFFVFFFYFVSMSFHFQMVRNVHVHSTRRNEIGWHCISKCCHKVRLLFNFGKQIKHFMRSKSIVNFVCSFDQASIKIDNGTRMTNACFYNFCFHFELASLTNHRTCLK